MHTHIAFSPQNLSNGLLQKLNVWFPGEFKAVVEPPLHIRNDTIVVQATRKVSAVLYFAMDLTAPQSMFAPPLCRLLAKWLLKSFKLVTLNDINGPREQ